MTDNADLRKEAANAIANYMHHELFVLSKGRSGDMLPWMSKQGEVIMDIVDRAIANTKADPRAKELL